jgi:starch-binding outer membrane protein, SusD/RagB family
MKMKKIFKYTVLSVGIVFGLSSCDDFFNILPLNEIVSESYFTEENDISRVVNSCYAGLEAPAGTNNGVPAATINLLAAWGEMRSDNIKVGSDASTDETQILKENILPTTKYSNWLPIYTVINRCNTVLYYAPLVNEIDPNYTISEMKANIAEVKAIRALCYFYLIRTFRDVPFVTEPSIDDAQNYRIAVTPFNDILNYLINDLDTVKEDAVRRYADEVNNTSRFTRYSIYALLADMELWKQDYVKCVEYCDKVISFKKQLYLEDVALNGDNTNLTLFKGIPLISEHLTSSTRCGISASKIFGEGNSFESIFELNFVQNQLVENSFIPLYYGYGSGTRIGRFSVSPFLIEYVATGANRIFKNTDCRYLESMGTGTSASTQYPITKYTRTYISFEAPLASSSTSPSVSYSTRSGNYANWIIYRLTDIMLMKAEAEIEIGKSLVNDSVAPATTLKPYLQSAFTLVSAVYNRANNKTLLSTDTLKYSDYGTSATAMQDLVQLERQRELLFEGKRWFDLVRRARREGRNDNLIINAIKKQTSNTGAIQIKLASTDGLYFPYSESELQNNPLLKQNPAYDTDITSTKTE